jgi:hypothetical protein
MYRNETNITFQRNPHLTYTHWFKRVTSFFNLVRKTFFGCVFNQFSIAPVTRSTDENLLPLVAYFIGPNIWKSLGARYGPFGMK